MPAECWKPECLAPIITAYSVTPEDEDEKPMPVDHDSIGGERGHLAVWRDRHGLLRWRRLREGEEPAEGESRAVSHWGTCVARRKH